ncbi:MAG: class I SAM-dependent methyltransferase [Hyphomonadaceae bacterium]
MSDDTARRAAIFTDIWRQHIWGGAESRSGPGSGVARTAPLRAALEALLEREQPQVFYDAPCGDFLWMSHVRLPARTLYIGSDIVAPLIADNEARYGAPGRTFHVADIVAEPPPAADVWLCRESLFHMPFADAQRVIAHWRGSAIPIFLATTTPTIICNHDIDTGDWRPLNLEIAPFDLGPPSEYLPDAAPADPAKRIGVWRR